MELNLSALLTEAKKRIELLPELGKQFIAAAESKAQAAELAQKEKELNLSALTRPKFSYTPPQIPQINQIKIPEFVSEKTPLIQSATALREEVKEKIGKPLAEMILPKPIDRTGSVFQNTLKAIQNALETPTVKTINEPLIAISKGIGGVLSGDIIPRKGETLEEYYQRQPMVMNVVQKELEKTGIPVLPVVGGFLAEMLVPPYLGKSEKFIDELAKTTEKEASKKLLMRGVKNISEGEADVLAGKLAPITDKTAIKTELENFAKAKISKTPAIPKELEPLAAEARKYKSAEEFVKNNEHLYRQENIFFGENGIVPKPKRIQKLSQEVDDLYKEKLIIPKAESPKGYSSITIGGGGKTMADDLRINKLNAQINLKLQEIEKWKSSINLKSQLINFYNQAVKEAPKEIGAQKQFPTKIPQKAQPPILPDKVQIVSPEASLEKEIAQVGEKNNLPVVIQGETFTLGETKTIQPTIKELRAGLRAEIKATKQEIKNAEIAAQKAAKLEVKQQKIREETIKNINRITRGNVENIRAELKARYLSDEDIDNIVLEDGTKLNEVIKVKRNPNGSMSTYITKQEIEDIARNYTDEIPKQKWEKRSMLVNGVEIPIKLAKSIELPYLYFERKGLGKTIYDPIIQAGRDAEMMKNIFIKKFEDANLFKRGGWFTADRFTLSKNEAEGVAKYYLGRQGKGKEIALNELSEKSRKFIEIFDRIIKETEDRFFEVAKKMGKTPRRVENYAPLMASKDIRLIDEGGFMDWLFRNHPAFFSLKERVEKVPLELYELDYREVAARWLEGITQFLNYSETTNHLKYLINSDQFKNIVKEEDWQFISKWLQDITTPQKPVSAGGQALNAMSRLLRKGVAIGTLGLNYASVLKQALTQIPIMILEKTPPKLKSEYAKAFGINVADLPSITKRRGDIAIRDLQGKISRIFTGALTEFDRKNAQLSLNGLLDKEYYKFLKEGVEITPEIQKLIEKRAMDGLDMWYGGFFSGQRPEAFRKELGNFILMFLYPMASQLNGFYRYILTSRGLGKKAIAGAEVLAAATTIAYMEQVIENLSFQWSDEKEMTRDVLLSLSGNIPMVGNIAYSIANEKEFNISPSLGNLNNIIRAMAKGENEKIFFVSAETLGLPRQIRRIKEGLEIMEAGGITDNDGKMIVPVQDAMELVRSFLRGKYGSIAARDWVRNIGEKSEDHRWFVPQVEFLQSGDYDRKAELYLQFTPDEQKELRNFLSENQQKKLDKALVDIKLRGGRKKLEDILLGNKRSLEEIFK